MRAQIDEDGKLSITPETPTEHYALAQWWKEYMKSHVSNPCEVVLEVCLIKIKEPGS